MPPFGLPEVIEAPSPSDDPTVASLFAVVPPTNPAGSRWAAGGVTWDPPGGCGGASRWANCSGANLPVSGPAAPPVFYAYQVVSGYRCSTVGSPEDPGRYARQAETVLDRHASGQAENELWSGTLAVANAWASPYLADGNAEAVNSGTATPYPIGMARLLDAVRDCYGNRRAVLHMAPFAAVLLSRSGLLRFDKDTGIYESPFGDVAVAGAGYTGGGRAADTIYTVSTTGSSGGTFRLTVTNPASGDSETTGAIAYNASAADVATALAALSSVAPSDVSVAGGPLPGSTVSVTFTGTFAMVDVALTGTSTLTGGALTVTETQTGGSVQATDYASTWVYATGPLITRAGPVEITPTEMRDTDTRTNTVTVFAERTVLAGFDTCCQLAVNLDLTSDGGAGGVVIDGGAP